MVRGKDCTAGDSLEIKGFPLHALWFDCRIFLQNTENAIAALRILNQWKQPAVNTVLFFKR
jgi:hypothetical protein